MQEMKTAWKIYFVIYSLLIISLVASTLSNKDTTLYTNTNLVLTLPSLIALFGWAWSKKIANNTIWLIYAPSFIILDLIYNIFLSEVNKQNWPAALFGLIIVTPSYIATVLYSIKFKKLRSRS